MGTTRGAMFLGAAVGALGLGHFLCNAGED